MSFIFVKKSFNLSQNMTESLGSSHPLRLFFRKFFQKRIPFYICQMKKLIVLISLAISLAGCSAYKQIDMSSLKLGMSKEQVIKALNKKPDNLIGAKEYKEGTVEVFQYTRHDFETGAIRERYWLYFLNDTLKQWGRPNDWQKQADQVYELRVR